MSYKILSCDGGGIRGLITALLIEDLDKNFGVVSKADGFAGTSTGGLIALGLSCGVSISNIVNIYQNQGSTIFEANGWFGTATADDTDDTHPSAMAALWSGPGVFSTQYKNDGLKKVAANLLGGATMDSTKKLVVINTARLWDSSSKSWEAATISSAPNNPYKNVLMQEAALATSAAPTYFPPYSIGSYGFFADGGVFANNPAITAIGEAISGGYVSDQSDLRVLSLGTGMAPQGIPSTSIPNPLKWGVSHWLWPAASGTVPAMALLSLTMDATAQIADLNAQKMLGANYCRGNYALPHPYGLEDWKNIANLVTWTKTYMNGSDWKRVKHWVSNNW